MSGSLQNLPEQEGDGIGEMDVEDFEGMYDDD